MILPYGKVVRGKKCQNWERWYHVPSSLAYSVLVLALSLMCSLVLMARNVPESAKVRFGTFELRSL